MRSSGMFLNNFGATHLCANCGHQKTNWRSASAKDGTFYSLLDGQDHYEDDVEGNAGAEHREGVVETEASHGEAF